MNAAAHRDEYESVAGFYDHIPPYASRPDVRFFVEAARDAGGPVLEVGCGTGRVLIPTARAGVRITGVDRSRAMLAICRRHLKAESPDVQAAVELVPGDMRSFALPSTFALATFPFRSFQHLLTVEDQIACLRSVHRHLDPGARLILDVFNPSIDALANRLEGVEYGGEPGFTMPDGCEVERKHLMAAHDRSNQIMHIELIYYVRYPDGRAERIVHAFGMRYLFRFEVEHLLDRCGFTLERVDAGYAGEAYGSVYPGELVCMARKSG